MKPFLLFWIFWNSFFYFQCSDALLYNHYLCGNRKGWSKTGQARPRIIRGPFIYIFCISKLAVNCAVTSPVLESESSCNQTAINNTSSSLPYPWIHLHNGPHSIMNRITIIKKGSRYVSTNMNVILQSKMFILTTSVWFVCALSCLSYLIPLMTYLKIIVWNMFSWSPDSRHIVWRHGFSNMHFPHQHVSNTAIAWIIETKYEDGKFINLYLPRSWPIAP